MADDILYSKLDGERKIIRVEKDGSLVYSTDGGETWLPVAANSIKWK